MNKSRTMISLSDIRNSACAGRNQHLFGDQHAKEKGKGKKGGKRTYKIGGRIVSKFYPTNSEEKDHMQLVLIDFCQRRCIQLHEEYIFTTDRGWRFDWCIPDLMIAVEYEGLMSEKSGHTTITGYTKDADKYNRAQKEGWRVLRFTALNYKQIYDRLQQI